MMHWLFLNKRRYRKSYESGRLVELLFSDMLATDRVQVCSAQLTQVNWFRLSLHIWLNKVRDNISPSLKGIRVVTLSSRIFIVGTDDTVYRLAGTKFTGMLTAPDNHLLPCFAGQRVRMAEVIVELHDRVPYSIVRLVYVILRFDERGRFDCETFSQQNAALVDDLLGNTLTNHTNKTAIIDASSRFVAQGGRWHPSPTLEKLICQSALDEIKYQRL